MRFSMVFMLATINGTYIGAPKKYSRLRYKYCYLRFIMYTTVFYIMELKS